MECTREVTDDIYWVGGNDRRLGLFENIHPVPEGVSYNSYLISDEKTCLMDTCDWAVGQRFLENVEAALNGRNLDVLVVDHMEPDHAATLNEVLIRWPNVEIYCTMMASRMYRQYGYKGIENLHTVAEGDTLSLGKHELTFYLAPMVHWPEVMVSYDKTTGILFSADAFGTFGALNGALFADEMEIDDEWFAEARRYYGNICGKYGMQVQNLLAKARGLEGLAMICPLHGPVWRKDLDLFIDKYDKWSRYEPEEKGVLIAYASMYGHTENCAEVLASELIQAGVTNVKLCDVSGTHVSYLISDVFKYSNIALFSVTYNMGVFPKMKDFIHDMQALNIQNRTVTILENGTWAPQSKDLMTSMLEEMQDMRVMEEKITVMSNASDDQREAICKMAEDIKATLEG